MVIACAPKIGPVDSKSSPDREPAQVEATKPPAQVRERTAVSSSRRPPENQVYFASIQILAQTESENACGDDLRRSEDVIENFVGTLTEDSQVVLSGVDSLDTLFNLSLRTIGFDESRYRFSQWDEGSSGIHPYDVKVLLRPSGDLEIQYLDQSIRFNPTASPISSFQAVERRGGCRINHLVNVYSENAGFYSLDFKR